MCGIFGQTFKSSSSFNKDKFKILGIYNESRGKQSSGFSINGDIYLSSTGNHLWTDFIQSHYDTFKQKPELIKSVIGHTRQASKGGISELNTHPFGFDTIIINNTPICKFIGEHNGSLYNEDDLAEEYGIDISKSFVNDYNKLVKHDKIDSEILLEIIYTSQNYEVLSKYQGGAALAWIDATKPNTLFLFHGKSKKYQYGTNIEEERPLFIWKEHKNSLYFSSLKEGLLAIGANPIDIIELPHNIVFEITDGNYDKAIQHVVNRDNVGQYIITKNTNFNNYYNRWDDDDRYDKYEKINTFTKPSNKSTTSSQENLNIFTESLELEPSQSPIVYNKLRYKLNGHNITGIFVATYSGLIPLGTKILEEQQFVDNFHNKYYSFKDKTFHSYYKSKDFVHVSLHGKHNLLYIYDGVLLKTEDDYKACQSLYSKYISVPYKEIAIASVYPVAQNVNSKKQGKKLKYSSDVFFNNISNKNPFKFTGTFIPVGSNKEYVFKNGQFQSVSKKHYVNQVKTTITYEAPDDVITLPPINKDTSTSENKLLLECTNEDNCNTDDSSNFENDLYEMINILSTQSVIISEYLSNLDSISQDDKDKIDDFKEILDSLDDALNEFVIENLNNIT